MMPGEERPPAYTTFIAALLTTLFIWAKPLFWVAIILVLALYLVAEPIEMPAKP